MALVIPSTTRKDMIPVSEVIGPMLETTEDKQLENAIEHVPDAELLLSP